MRAVSGILLFISVLLFSSLTLVSDDNVDMVKKMKNTVKSLSAQELENALNKISENDEFIKFAILCNEMYIKLYNQSFLTDQYTEELKLRIAQYESLVLKNQKKLLSMKIKDIIVFSEVIGDTYFCDTSKKLDQITFYYIAYKNCAISDNCISRYKGVLNSIYRRYEQVKEKTLNDYDMKNIFTEDGKASTLNMLIPEYIKFELDNVEKENISHNAKLVDVELFSLSLVKLKELSRVYDRQQQINATDQKILLDLEKLNQTKIQNLELYETEKKVFFDYLKSVTALNFHDLTLKINNLSRFKKIIANDKNFMNESEIEHLSELDRLFLKGMIRIYFFKEYAEVAESLKNTSLDNYNLNILLAICQVKLNQKEMALLSLRKCIEISPNDKYVKHLIIELSE